MPALGQKRTLVLIRSPRRRARAVYPVHNLVTKNRTSCRVVAVPAPAMKPSKKLQRRCWFFDRWIKRWASFRVASIPSHSLRVRVISSAAIRSVLDRWITATASFRVASISSAAIRSGPRWSRRDQSPDCRPPRSGRLFPLRQADVADALTLKQVAQFLADLLGWEAPRHYLGSAAGLVCVSRTEGHDHDPDGTHYYDSPKESASARAVRDWVGNRPPQ